MEISGVQSLGRQGWNVGVRRSSVTGKTRLEWTEVSEAVSLGRLGWNGLKFQEFSHWEDKAGMD